MIETGVPAILLTQGGGHGHLIDVGVSIGPTVLRVGLLLAIPVVAGFALLRGFLDEPDRRSLAAVVSASGVVATLELLLSGGLNLSERLVPLLLALLALPIYLVLSRDERFRPAVAGARRYAPWVFWPVAALAAWQFASAWFAGADVSALHTGVVLAVVALAWFAITRTRRVASTIGARIGAAALAMALIAGGAQAMVLRTDAPVPGEAVSAEVGTGDDVLVVPNLPGWNLVRVADGGAEVAVADGDFVPAVPRPGATGTWAAVELTEGPGEVRIRRAGGTGSLTVDTGTGAEAPAGLAGTDGAECATALLSTALATGTPAPAGFRCPADTLSDVDADTLRDIVAAQDGRRLAVVGDDSPRGRAAERVVRAAAERAGIDVVTASEPVVIVAGWTVAAARDWPHRTVHAAPWLATEPVLAKGLPSVPDLGDYGTAFGERYPRLALSVSGYRAWRAARAAVVPADRAAP